MRVRLIELILHTPQKQAVIQGRANGKTYRTVENIADHLLANGVIVPPCKMGDTVYRVITMGTGVHSKCIQKKSIGCYYGVSVPCEETIKKFIRSVTVTRNNFFDVIENFGETVFLSREEAENKLKERENNE